MVSRRILASQEVNSEMHNLCSHDDLNTSESQRRLRYKSRTIIFRKKYTISRGGSKTQKRNVKNSQCSYFNTLLENVHVDPAYKDLAA